MAGPRATLPQGSEGEAPLRSGTLVLGSGVPIEGPLPALRPTRPLRDERPARPVVGREPRPERREVGRDPRGVRQRVPRLERLAEPPGQSEVAARGARHYPRALWGLVPLLVLALVALAVVFAKRRPTLAAETRFDLAGSPELHLKCDSCADGSTVSLGAESATVTGGRAVLRLAPPLSLGRQRTTLEVRVAGESSARTEQVEYDVEFVASADQRGLAQPDPKLAVVFDAKPEVSVVVDGRVVAPSSSGIRRYEIPVRADLTGPAREPTTLVKKVTYLVKRANGESLRGELELRVEVASLVVDAPGESIVIEGTSFVLAGLTERDGSITVEGRPITVDPGGRFAQLMSVSSIGNTTISVRASAPGRAPRIYPIRVKRVSSLAAEAVEFERHAQSSYAALVENADDKRGWAVVLEGKVGEVKSDGYVSSLLLEVTRGCATPPCLARLRLGERTSLAPGANVTAYGYLAGNSADPATGRGLPEVRVEFLRGKP